MSLISLIKLLSMSISLLSFLMKLTAFIDATRSNRYA